MLSIQKQTIFLFTILTSFVTSGVCEAQSSISSSAIQKAKSFVGTRNTGKYILEFVHFGATYQRHSLNRVAAVKDSKGKLIPGEFAVIYDFVWDASGTGKTRLAIFCDKYGKVKGVKSMHCDAFVNTPFTFADGTIKVVGQLIVEAFGSQMSATDKRTVQSLINSANSKGLLEFGLAMRQRMGIR